MAGPSSPRSMRPTLARLQDEVTGQDNYDSFISTTSTQFGSESALLSDAPTPHNTYSAPDAFDPGRNEGDEDGEEVLYPGTAGGVGGGGGHGDVSLHPSITPTPSLTSGRPSFHSSHPSMHLLSSATSRPDSLSITGGNIGPGQGVDSVPRSQRSVPAPPLSLRSQDTASGLPITPLSHTSFLAPSTPPTTGSNLDSDQEGLKTVSGIEGEGDGVSSVFRGKKFKSRTDVDAQRLRQLGYDAVLGRDYTFWSSLCISTLNIGSLQGALYAVSGTYNYGGPVMILVAWPLSGLFSLFLTLTMSELASAYPVSGAMASWAWKAARGGVGHERAWGWLMGGVVLGGHVGNVILVTWEICKIITGTMTVAFDYEEQRWHLALFFLAVLAVCGVTGATAWGRSHHFWLAAGALFMSVWLILNGSLIAGVAKNPSRGISTEFWNSSGWNSRGYVGLLGWQYCTIASGMDASAHMAEETKNPSRNVPNAMTMSMVLTYFFGYISIVLLLLAVDPADATSISTHSFPAGHILEQAVSRSGSIAISCLLILILTIQVLAQLQASSRFVFSLARDNAMPFSKSIQYTNSSKQPVVAHLLVIALCLPFATLTLAGEGTLYSVLAVTASSLSYFAYVVPVLLYLLSKKDLQTEGRTSWSMRGLSKPFGWIGVTFGVAVVIVQMLPGHRPVTASNVSWSPLVLVGTALICLLTWKLYGSKHYSGPIRALTKWQTGVEIDLQSALASSRSRPSGHINTDDETGRTRRRPSDSSVKLDTTFSHPDEEGGYNGTVVTHSVTVGSARTMDIEPVSSGEWEEGVNTGMTGLTGLSGMSDVSEWRDGEVSRGGGDESRHR